MLWRRGSWRARPGRFHLGAGGGSGSGTVTPPPLPPPHGLARPNGPRAGSRHHRRTRGFERGSSRGPAGQLLPPPRGGASAPDGGSHVARGKARDSPPPQLFAHTGGGRRAPGAVRGSVHPGHVATRELLFPNGRRRPRAPPPPCLGVTWCPPLSAWRRRSLAVGWRGAPGGPLAAGGVAPALKIKGSDRAPYKSCPQETPARAALSPRAGSGSSPPAGNARSCGARSRWGGRCGARGPRYPPRGRGAGALGLLPGGIGFCSCCLLISCRGVRPRWPPTAFVVSLHSPLLQVQVTWISSPKKSFRLVSGARSTSESCLFKSFHVAF